MRRGLQRLLAEVGAPASKYHERLTAAWLLAVNHFMQMTGPTHRFEQFAGSAGPLFDQEIMQTHYTRELLSPTPRARATAQLRSGRLAKPAWRRCG